MTKTLKIAALAASVFAATPAFAAPVQASPPPTATARIIKPLALTSTGSLNFGTIVLNGVTADRTVALSAGNVLDCAGLSPELQCTGATSVPSYNVRGTNRQVVTVIKAATNLTNANDGTTLSMTPTGVASVTLPNSGVSGVDFSIGGTIVIGTGTTDGVYSGVVDVRVDYP